MEFWYQPNYPNTTTSADHVLWQGFWATATHYFSSRRRPPITASSSDQRRWIRTRQLHGACGRLTAGGRTTGSTCEWSGMPATLASQCASSSTVSSLSTRDPLGQQRAPAQDRQRYIGTETGTHRAPGRPRRVPRTIGRSTRPRRCRSPRGPHDQRERVPRGRRPRTGPWPSRGVDATTRRAVPLFGSGLELPWPERGAADGGAQAWPPATSSGSTGTARQLGGPRGGLSGLHVRLHRHHEPLHEERAPVLDVDPRRPGRPTR